jgi:transposase-like protein
MSKDQTLLSAGAESNETPLAAERALGRASEAASGRPVTDLPPTIHPAGRFSAGRKAHAVVRLLAGESLETLSRQLGITAATLSQWREDFLAAGTSALKSHANEHDHRGELIERLRAKIGELTMENELLYEKARRLDEQLPLARRRSRQ